MPLMVQNSSWQNDPDRNKNLDNVFRPNKFSFYRGCTIDILHAAENIEEITELIPTNTAVTSAECRMYAGSGRWTSDCRTSSQSSPQEGLILPVQLIQQKSTASDNALYLELPSILRSSAAGIVTLPVRAEAEHVKRRASRSRWTMCEDLTTPAYRRKRQEAGSPP